MLPFADEVIRDLTLTVGDETVVLEWGAEEEVGYEIQASPDLSEGSWETLDDVEIVLEEGVASAEIAKATSRNFLRVKLVE